METVMSDIRVTVLVENTVYQRGLRAEHGLALWIETNDKKILFDTGQSDLLLHNAKILGIDIAEADAIVLSHGHYDHVGGLNRVLDLAPKARVCLHPMTLEPKFSFSNGSSRDAGITSALRDKLRGRIECGQGAFTTDKTSVFPGVTVTGQIPRVSGFEDTGGQFFLDTKGETPDELLDDQALLLDSENGFVVVLGCAHAGVVNTLEHIQQIEPDKNVYAVLGGMHLVNASQTRVQKTIDALRRLDIDKIGPAHCTGQPAARQLWNSLGDRCFLCCAGRQVSF
ncbi:MAG TPA: MBL fold metallo-hydrolase [Phycisphaerales bacterium]|nr:MBL fold metallo-hydrolase [Phycisphaerales bacterium]